MQQYLWQQFGGAIDMLENAMLACPPELWDTPARFWYISYHLLFWTDYYLSDTPLEADYQPPHPFTRAEFEDRLPERVYSKEELLDFLKSARERLRRQLQSNTAEDLLNRRFTSEYKDFSLFELLLYNMRHVQHHTAQLNLLLRQGINSAPDWVSATEEPLRQGASS